MLEINSVVDLSHHSQNLDFSQMKNAGNVLGIIHKVTQGVMYTDPTYQFHRTAALNAGILWGAYHFGTGSDGIEQEQHFLDGVQPDNQTLMVLDFEGNPQGPSMSLEEARGFVTHIHDATGTWPGFYSGHYIKQLVGTDSDPRKLLVLARAIWADCCGPPELAYVDYVAIHGWCRRTAPTQRARSWSL